MIGRQKRDVLADVSRCLVRSANAVELGGQSALLVSSVVLVQQTLRGRLVHDLHCDLVSTLGLGAIAFSGSRLELLECGLQCGLVSLVAGVTHLSELDALLGRLNIRQTKHLLRLGFDGEHKKSTVQNGILTKFSRNCKHFFQIFSTFLYASKFFIAAIKGIAGFAILAMINLWLTLIIFVIVPVMVLSCMKLNRKMKKAFAAQRYQIGELNARIEDTLLGQKVVKAFTNEDMENQKFDGDNHSFFGIKKETYKYMGAFQTTTRMFDGVMYLAVVVAGGIFMVRGMILPGDLVAYMLYVTTFIATIRRIIEFAEQFQRGMTGIERFLQIMDAKIDIFDEPGAVELKDVTGDITFKDVSFEYPDDHNQVFENLNLTIRPGEKVAIVGPSGGGKTTLCNLIPRFYDIDSGEISIDGKNIKSFTLKSLRQQIGIVQQDVYLFSGTVYDNIVYGSLNATKEQVIEAAKLAGADGFIRELKDGYQTYIGERGVKLSGGQKQRISIARVFLKNPAILILDEATSALDNESEYEVAKSLEKLSKGRTTITIAHRLSSIRNSDRILVLTQEGIAEEGNHEALMEKKGIYYQFYTMADRLK